MKKNYVVLLLAVLFSGITNAQETQKNFINYQGVARNAQNQLMASEAMMLTIALKFGAANSSAVYEESHAITTDANGVFSLLIGNGSAMFGNYNALPWGSAATFVTVSMNGNEIGTTEMMAVPYAISAGNMKDPTAEEVSYDNTASGLSATTTQGAIDELVTGGSVDADADPSNELQMLNFDASTNELSLSDGNSVTIPSGGTDADADPENEIQTISFDPATNELSLTEGGSVIIPSGGTDADADPENELQTLEFNTTTNELSLSNGNTITIPTGGTDADADPENEIQTISFNATTNELSLTDGGSVIIPSGGTDADADPENELQSLSLSGTNLNISNGTGVDLAPLIPPGGTDNQELTFNETTNMLQIEDGNTVDLSSLLGAGSGSSVWSPAGLGAIYYADGNVGIGTTDPKNEHHVHSSGASSTLYTLGGFGETATDGLSVGLADGLGAAVGFVRLNEDGPLNLGTNSQTRVSIRGNGRVGIGTQAPTSELDVDGAIRSRDLRGGGNVVADTDGNLVIGSAGGGSSPWKESGNNIYYNSGNIGLGLTNPQNAWMHIQTNSTVSKPHLLLEEEGADYARLELKNDQSVAYWHIAGRPSMNTAQSKLNFYHHDGTTGSDRMTILGNGNVGINTGAPAHKLDVNGSFNINGDFANQGVYQVYPLRSGPWRPSSSASGARVRFPNATLTVDVPLGSKALVGYNISGAIDSDKIHFFVYRDGILINQTLQGCYDVAGTFAQWTFNSTHLDKEVSAGSHTYHLEVYQSDDADDNYWHGGSSIPTTASFYVLVIKE